MLIMLWVVFRLFFSIFPAQARFKCQNDVNRSRFLISLRPRTLVKNQPCSTPLEFAPVSEEAGTVYLFQRFYYFYGVFWCVGDGQNFGFGSLSIVGWCFLRCMMLIACIFVFVCVKGIRVCVVEYRNQHQELFVWVWLQLNLRCTLGII